MYNLKGVKGLFYNSCGLLFRVTSHIFVAIVKQSYFYMIERY